MMSLQDSGESSAADVAPAGAALVREGIVTLPGTLPLHFGGQLENVQIAWRLDGAGPVVAALGGISAGRHVTGRNPKGWWADVVGPNGALDTRQFQILGFDFLGGSGQTTGPQRDEQGFPSISAFDQAEILRRLLDHLGIERLHAIAGASYGAMVALAFAACFPQRVARVIAISGADRTHPMSTAWRSVQRAVVRYAVGKDDGPEGLRLARALAMATYRSSREFETRFNGPATRTEDRFQFPVEQYLLSRGDAYASTYIPEAFVCLSESIDLHAVDAAQIRVPVTLVAVREDQIVPLADMQRLHAMLPSAQLIEISSLYGHDAFLKEVDVLRTVFQRALKDAP